MTKRPTVSCTLVTDTGNETALSSRWRNVFPACRLLLLLLLLLLPLPPLLATAATDPGRYIFYLVEVVYSKSGPHIIRRE